MRKRCTLHNSRKPGVMKRCTFALDLESRDSSALVRIEACLYGLKDETKAA